MKLLMRRAFYKLPPELKGILVKAYEIIGIIGLNTFDCEF